MPTTERSEPHRVSPPSSGAPAASHRAPTGAAPNTAAQRPWLVRKRGATEVLRCPDLPTLYQWIVEKRLVRDDEVSRGGRKWRRMSAIVELESLFYSAEQERATRRRTGQHTPVALPTVPEPPRATPPPIPVAPRVEAAPPPPPPPDPAPTAAAAPSASNDKAERDKKDSGPLGPLKVTPPGLAASGAGMLPMRLVRNPPGRKPAMPGMGGSVQAAMRGTKSPAAAEGLASKPAPKPARSTSEAEITKEEVRPPAKDSSRESGGQTLLYKRGASNPPRDEDHDVEDNDETRRIMQQEPDNDETRRIPADQAPDRRGRRDPVEDALLRNDPVPRSIADAARGGQGKVPDARATDFITDAHPTTGGGRRIGVILAVVGVLGLGVWYATRTPETPPQTTNSVETGTGSTGTSATGTGTGTGTSTSGTEPAVTPSKPVAEPIVKPVAEPIADPVKPPPGTPPATAATGTGTTATGTGTTATGTGTAATPGTQPKGPATATPAAQTGTATATAKPDAAKPATSPGATTGTPAAGTEAPKTAITMEELRKFIDGEVPKTFDGQIELANKLFERGKYDQSKMIYEFMLTYASSVPAIHKGLGDIAFERNQGDEALKHFNNALERRASYSAAVFGLAKTYHHRKNDKEKALQNYIKYLEMNSKGAAATLAREAITKLGGTPPAAPAPAPVPATPAIVP